MRVGSLASARPAYYDRNAAAQTNEYYGGVSPHAQTTRYTYTAPSGKKGVLEYGYVLLERTVAATVAGTVFGLVACQSGGITVRIPFFSTTTNTVGVVGSIHLPCAVTIYAGEQVQGITFDNSTLGTIYYTIQSKLTVFDA